MEEKLDAETLAILSALEAGDLEGDARAQVEALVARLPTAAATVARLRQLRALTAELADPSLLPATLWLIGDRALVALDAGRRRTLALVASCVAAALIVGLVFRPWRSPTTPAEHELHTAAGEHRLLQIGRATRSSASTAWFASTTGAPLRILTRARVRVMVRPDSDAPKFVVATAAADAIVHGTEFDVDVTNDTTDVRVARGEVEVRNGYGTRRLWAGEEARARVGAAPRRVVEIHSLILDGPAEIEPMPRSHP